MKLKTCLLFLAITAVLSSGCFGKSTTRPTPTPTPTVSWNETLAATARAVVAATFFAPTHTPTPTATATVTPTPTPTQITPAFTSTPVVANCIPADSEAQIGRVINVIDGETIRVEIGGTEYKVRYIGIKAGGLSSNRQPFADSAANINENLVRGRTVQLFKDAANADRSGELLRYVYVGSIFVNYELIRLGLATALDEPPDSACFATLHEAEHEANTRRVGLWSVLVPTKTPLGYGLEHVVEVPCDCYGPELDCADFPFQLAAQACFNYCKSLGLGDLFDLDPNNNLRACEGLP